MPIESLIRYRSEIDALLPSTKLKDVDVESELVLQLRLAQAFQARCLDNDEGIPVNQLAQALNSTSAIIEKLAKLQIDLAASENLKRMESALIKALDLLPDEAKEVFFENYGKVAAEEGIEV